MAEEGEREVQERTDFVVGEDGGERDQGQEDETGERADVMDVVEEGDDVAEEGD